MTSSIDDELFADIDSDLRKVVEHLRETVSELVPDAVEEPDAAAKMLGFTYQPGTYKGLILAIAPHAKHVNLMFSKGVELLDVDSGAILEGTGKKARHIKFRQVAEVANPDVHALIVEAARLTPRS